MTDVKGFVDYGKANPGKLNYGSSGGGPQIACGLLKVTAGIDMVEVPYNGTAPIMLAMAQGTVDMFMGSYSSVMPSVQAGKAVAVGAVSDVRNPDLPDMPTLKEQGFDVVYDVWYGLLAPAKTPDAILDKVNTDFNAAMNTEAVRAQLHKLGFIRKLQSRGEFAETLKSEVEKTLRVVRDAKLRAG